VGTVFSFPCMYGCIDRERENVDGEG